MKNLLIISGIIAITFSSALAQEKIAEKSAGTAVDNSDKLVVVWTSGDKEVAVKMVYMYVFNAKKYGWWKDITFIIWGPSSKLLSEDTDLQEYLAKMKDENIALKACKACSDMYGVSEKLTELGVEVKYMGVELTDFIKENRYVLTF